MIWQFLSAHKEAVIFLGLAFVVTMPPELPYPLCRLRPLAWAWTWAHDALKTFASTRGPKA